MCVMKQIDIGKMSESERKETVKEAKILEVLSHPNIVKFIEVFKTKNGKLCIIMDFADGKINILLTICFKVAICKTERRSKGGDNSLRLKCSSGLLRYALDLSTFMTGRSYIEI